MKKESKQTTSTLTTLHNLYFSENKPEELLPLDLALATYLVLRQTDDHAIFDSQDTLAERLGCERKAVARSIERLEQAGWITVHKPMSWSDKTKRRTRAMAWTLGLSINLAALPQHSDRAKRSNPSEDAKYLAAEHNKIVRMASRSERLPPNFARQQQYAAQRLIDELGDADAVFDLVNFAIDDGRFTRAATKSLYELRRRLKAIRPAFEEFRAQDVQQEQPEEQPA